MKLNINLNMQIDTFLDREYKEFKELIDVVHKLNAEYVPISFSITPVDDKN